MAVVSLPRCVGEELTRGLIELSTPSGFRVVGASLTCGYEGATAVGQDYEAPFIFAGTIPRAFVETRGPLDRGPLAELEAILSP